MRIVRLSLRRAYTFVVLALVIAFLGVLIDWHHGGRYRAQIDNGMVERPEEIAQTIVFLASDRASFITGASYLADGGKTAQ